MSSKALTKCIVSILIVLTVAACGGAASPDEVAISERETFLDNLRKLCGQSFAGTLVSEDEVDDDLRGQLMVMHVRDCTSDVIRMPFHVGDDHSRTWVITDLADGLLLEHIHRHEDGSLDAITMYGGRTATGLKGTNENSEVWQNFPANKKTKELFVRENIAVSAQNVWRMEVQPGKLFAYQMSRPNRLFRVEFDLTNPVDAPPAAWGYGDE